MIKKNRKIWILQWMAFIMAIIAFLFLAFVYFGYTSVKPKFVIPILVAIYGMIIGIIGLLKQRMYANKNNMVHQINRTRHNLYLFYIMMSICILIIVVYNILKFN